MKKKSLLQTNPFLADARQRNVLIEKTVVSSTAIEGVHAAAKRAVKQKNSITPSSQNSKSALAPH